MSGMDLPAGKLSNYQTRIKKGWPDINDDKK
jgi:hypothetical protein